MQEYGNEQTYSIDIFFGQTDETVWERRNQLSEKNARGLKQQSWQFFKKKSLKLYRKNTGLILSNIWKKNELFLITFKILVQMFKGYKWKKVLITLAQSAFTVICYKGFL